MAAINPALLARGINPVDIIGVTQAAANVKLTNTRNELFKVGLANEPAKQAQAAGKENRAQAKFDRESLFSSANDYILAVESGNRSGMLNAIKGLPEQIRDEALAAFNSQSTEDDAQILATARAIKQAGDDEGFFETAGQGKGPTSDIQNFSFVKNLSTEDRELFFQAKRAGQIKEIGGVMSVISGRKFVPLEGPDGPTSLEDVVNAKRLIAAAAERGKQTELIAAIAPKAAETRAQSVITDAPANIKQAETRIETIDNALIAVNDAINNIGVTTTGVLGKVLSLKPGSDRKDLVSSYSTIKGILGIDAIKGLRAESKTGSTGFGALNETELEGLQSSVAALDPDLSPEQQIKNINTIKRHLLRQRAIAKQIADLNAGRISEADAQVLVRKEFKEIESQFPLEPTKVPGFNQLTPQQQQRLTELMEKQRG